MNENQSLDLLGKHRLLKLKKKNRGNVKLISAIESLIKDIENAERKNKMDLISYRKDADLVHSDGFYFFNLHIHRTMVLIVFEENEASIIWTGTHLEYDSTFKGNKKTIEKWLRSQQLI